ncbi:MAG TPA: VOC family protein [Dehalococcoidia bacterium]|nr:VOC family protein [Dehalococcoidia bacterium]
MLKAFFHTGFVVKDLDQTIDFYTRVLGLRVAGRMERSGDFACQLLAFDHAHIKGAFLDLGDGHQLELIQYLTPPSGPGGINRNDLGASHLAFFVENIEQFHAEKSREGLRFNSGPAALYNDAGKLLRQALYAQDPDGNWLEFVELA